jgi:flagellar L-ring protein FlgH
MNNARIILLSMCVMAVTVWPARAESLWNKGNSRTQATFSDDTARNTGDSLTIIIEEKSKIENDTTRTLDKSDSRSAVGGGTLDLANAVGHPVGKDIFNFPNIDTSLEAKSKFDGKANYGSDHSMLDRITVTIQDVLPNGNLVVLGKRERETDGDKQIIQATGIVRLSDITFDNTVRSDQVAEFHLVYVSKGQEKQATNPGWLVRILNFLNPF